MVDFQPDDEHDTAAFLRMIILRSAIEEVTLFTLPVHPDETLGEAFDRRSRVHVGADYAGCQRAAELMLPLAAYLCSQDADILNPAAPNRRPQLIRPRLHYKAERMRVVNWQVGSRIGAALEKTSGCGVWQGSFDGTPELYAANYRFSFKAQAKPAAPAPKPEPKKEPAPEPLSLTLTPEMSLSAALNELIAEVKRRDAKRSQARCLPGVLRALAAAKLSLSLPVNLLNVKIGAGADRPQGTAGPLVIGRSVLYCAPAPTQALLEACRADLEKKCRPFIFTLPERVHAAKALLEDAGLIDKVEVWDLVQHLAAWLELTALAGEDLLPKFAAVYNKLLPECGAVQAGELILKRT